MVGACHTVGMVTATEAHAYADANADAKAARSVAGVNMA